jgi:hypothetical protein
MRSLCCLCMCSLKIMYFDAASVKPKENRRLVLPRAFFGYKYVEFDEFVSRGIIDTCRTCMPMFALQQPNAKSLLPALRFCY